MSNPCLAPEVYWTQSRRLIPTIQGSGYVKQVGKAVTTVG